MPSLSSAKRASSSYGYIPTNITKHSPQGQAPSANEMLPCIADMPIAELVWKDRRRLSWHQYPADFSLWHLRRSRLTMIFVVRFFCA